MKKASTLLIVAALILTMLMPLTAGAAEVYVSHAEIGIVVNGRGVNNSLRKYPFIVYNSITYFPMTYNDCAYLGLSNTWTAEAGNIITKAEEIDCYDDFLNPLQNDEDKGGMAQIAMTPINVLGESIDNLKEQYPILNYRNLLYFPLTWDWGQKFGWSITFTENNILEVATENYKDKGSYYVFDLFDGKVSKGKLAAYKGDFYELNGNYKYYSFSPDYTLLRNAEVKDFVQLYRLLDGGVGEKGTTYISVKKELADEFVQNGWFTGDKLDERVLLYMKNHTKSELIEAIHDISTKGTDQTFLKNVNNYYFGGFDNYESLVKSPTEVCTVRKDQVYAYTSQGWQTSFDYLMSMVIKKEKAKQFGEAMKYIECADYSSFMDNYGIDMPYIDCSGNYERMKDKFYSLAQKLYGSGADGVKLAYTAKRYETSNYGIFVVKFKPGNLLADFTVSYDLATLDGTIVQRGLTGYGSSYTMEGQRYDIGEVYFDSPDDQLYNVTNVKVTNVTFSQDAVFGAG